METIRIGLLGAGTVGSAFATLLGQHTSRLEAIEVKAELTKVFVRDQTKARPGIPSDLLTSEVSNFLNDIDVLVEVMGGTTLAGEMVIDALERGIPVVTANKALLAERWEELSVAATEGELYYEAAVMAGTPMISTLESLWGNQIMELHGIINGSCSYIIRRMEEGSTYQEAFDEADGLGYLEADPNLDVGGIDAAHKLTVLARLTADPKITWQEVRANTRGIEHLTPQMLQSAKQEGKAIRLVASLYPENGRWIAAVRTVRLAQNHPLVVLGSGRNAVVYKGDPIGEVFVGGPGAGGAETATAVLSDLYRVLLGLPGHLPIPAKQPVPTQAVAKLEEV